jgi:hypothetical protein
VKNVQSVSFSAEHGQGAMLEVNLKFLPSEQVAQVTMQRVQNGKLPFCDWTARRVSFSLPTLSELVLAELSAGVKCHELETTEMQLGKISLLAS